MLKFDISAVPQPFYENSSAWITVAIEFNGQRYQAQTLKWRLVDLRSGQLLVDWTDLSPTYPVCEIPPLDILDGGKTELKRLTASATWNNTAIGINNFSDNAIFDFEIRSIF